MPLLDQDQSLETILKSGCGFSSRKSPTLATILSPSMPHPVRAQHWLSQKGFHKCGGSRCPMCRYTVKTAHVQDPINREKRIIQQFINCNSNHVVYHILCLECNKGYVGCTTRKLKTRIQEHIRDSNNCIASNASNVSKHFSQHHQGDLSSLRIYGRERVNRPRRGGDWRRALLNREAFWILRLATSHPRGLNYRSDLILHY